MNLINNLINNQVSELFALICFFAGAGIMYAIMKDTENERKNCKRDTEIHKPEMAELGPFR